MTAVLPCPSFCEGHDDFDWVGPDEPVLHVGPALAVTISGSAASWSAEVIVQLNALDAIGRDRKVYIELVVGRSFAEMSPAQADQVARHLLAGAELLDTCASRTGAHPPRAAADAGRLSGPGTARARTRWTVAVDGPVARAVVTVKVLVPQARSNNGAALVLGVPGRVAGLEMIELTSTEARHLADRLSHCCAPNNHT
ncbi:DUF6907 domain-containing protein [Nocardia tengchongensis]|uniref:DUF6907 domain-containing protein n=1 Tax=Nocardia tengchongensis TaxID=2055889 RepID=UPI003609B9D4